MPSCPGLLAVCPSPLPSSFASRWRADRHSAGSSDLRRGCCGWPAAGTPGFTGSRSRARVGPFGGDHRPAARPWRCGDGEDGVRLCAPRGRGEQVPSSDPAGKFAFVFLLGPFILCPMPAVNTACSLPVTSQELGSLPLLLASCLLASCKPQSQICGTRTQVRPMRLCAERLCTDELFSLWE
jgi:hypothetical protein